MSPRRVWNIHEQAEIARKSFEAWPAWFKRVCYFAGTNSTPLVCRVCHLPLGPAGITEDAGATWVHLKCHSGSNDA